MASPGFQIILALAQKAATMLGLKRISRILVTEESVSPFLFGVLQPVLVIPAGLVNKVCDEALLAVCAHEFAHLRRRDPLVGWILAICEVIYFFHPVFYFVKRQILFERERACDDWVIATSKAKRSIYANALISAADVCRTFSAKVGPVGVVAESFGDLRKRLIAIGSNLRPKAQLSITALIFLVVTGVICVPGIALTARQTTQAKDGTAEAMKDVSSSQATGPVISEHRELPSATEGEARVLHFPKDRSLGRIMVQDVDLKRQIQNFSYWIDGASWFEAEYLGEAQGDVTIPAGKKVGLMVSKNAVRDLSPLLSLKSDDLYMLSLRTLPATNGCMRYITHLTGLKELDLYGTNITSAGIKPVTKLKSLEMLTLPKSITDRSLYYIGQLVSLKRLHLIESSATDAGLAHLSRLTSLEELSLAGEHINGAGLVHLTNFPSLYYLNLNGKNFGDAGLAYLRKVPSLKILYLFETSTTDAGVHHLSGHAGLENLAFIRTQLTDRSMAYLKSMPSLKKLNIYKESRVTDRGMAHLGQINSLESLDLPDISDKGVASIAKLKNLKHLHIYGGSSSTNTDTSLKHISKLQSLESLSIPGHGYTNSGMDDLAKLTNLRELDISADAVTNEGLASLKALKSLEILTFGSKNVTISGLSHLNALKNLSLLDLRGIQQDNSGMDISGLTKLERLTLKLKMPQRRGDSYDPVRDEDLACLKKLTNLRWLQFL